MANIIAESYKNYTSSKNNFELFHNQVINMPRPTFSEIPRIIKLMKVIASYILLIDSDKLSKPMGIKDIYHEIFNNYKCGIIPASNRDTEFEKRYLDRKESFEFLYSDDGKCGRMFRHYMALFTFFGYFRIGNLKSSRIADVDSLLELQLTGESILFDVLRGRLLDVNINNNPFISVMGLKIDNKADYRPCRAILRYCNEIKRKVTDFEISILLGRVDEVQNENEILSRALKIGKVLPATKEDQEKYFFGCMNWKNAAKEKYEYQPSQNPDFKFKTFLILMDTFNLINYNYTSRSSSHMIELTEYSKEIIKQDIPMEVVDLQNLLNMIDDQSQDSNILADLILRKRTDTITKAIHEDGLLVEKLNKRNLHFPILKNNKRVRSKLILEVAKIKANYLDEVTLKPSFEGKNGKNYVEAHHIIEFNGENGPDITDNLICLGPENHSLIHHGSTNAIDDFYNTCKSRGVLSFDRFKGFVVKYQCLTREHVKILRDKKIISKIDAEELNCLIDQYGINEAFLRSLQIPTNV